MCSEQGHKQRGRPQRQQDKADKGVHGQSHGQAPKQQQGSIRDPAHHTRSKTPGMAPASANEYMISSKGGACGD